jgi:hypothetical protein
MRIACSFGVMAVLTILGAYGYIAWEAAGRRRLHRGRTWARAMLRPREDPYERHVRRASARRLEAWR